jgi:2-polyprenyl-3-methyl-5-hydroxy-6-metoxy-1,4-benzoquinol methylase
MTKAFWERKAAMHDSSIANNAAITADNVCPSCGCGGAVIGYSYWEDVYRCSRCELCFLRKAVRSNADKDNHWYAELDEAKRDQIDSFFAAMGDAYVAQLNVLGQMTPGRSILDVGCGVGILLAVAKQRGWSVSGVETSEHAARFAAKHFEIDYAQSLDELPAHSLDVIRLSHVLEHIPEPMTFLPLLSKLLKPQGIVAVIVPNREPLCAAIVNRIRGLRSAKPKLAGAIYPDMHVLGFSPRSLSHLMENVGFESLTVFTVSMGSSTYFPMLYNGLLLRERFSEISRRNLLRHFLPMLVDNLGNRFGRGHWVVGYFRKPA